MQRTPIVRVSACVDEHTLESYTVHNVVLYGRIVANSGELISLHAGSSWGFGQRKNESLAKRAEEGMMGIYPQTRKKSLHAG